MKIFQIKIDNFDYETGVNAVSLVECPAIEKDFVKFSKEKPIEMKFNEEKHIISGPAIIADLPIYRVNETLGEHYVVFSKETIEQIVEKFFTIGANVSVNIEHDSEKFVGGITLIESYIKNSERGINPEEYKDIADGSWMISYKVNNIKLWDLIKKGDVKGFSIEGWFNYDEGKQFDEKMKSEENFDEYVEKFLN